MFGHSAICAKIKCQRDSLRLASFSFIGLGKHELQTFQVHKLRASNFLINPSLNKGWGFCNKMCKETNKIFDDELQQLKIKILSDELCKKFGSIYENNKLRLIANTRKELCGGFVNNVNVTIANYTLEQRDDKM